MPWKKQGSILLLINPQLWNNLEIRGETEAILSCLFCFHFHFISFFGVPNNQNQLIFSCQFGGLRHVQTDKFLYIVILRLVIETH